MYLKERGITGINLEDGRILHREISGDKPLDGEHRIIDGYHSSYILERFKGGLFNGDYEEYIYNKLKAKSSYKEGGRTEPAGSMTMKVG